MTGFRSRSIGPLLLLCAAALSCGSNRQLNSVALNPPTADAKNSANGEVQFTATGVFSNSNTPVTLTSKDITWCYGGPAPVATFTSGQCAGNIAQVASVDQNGLAQCNSGYQGQVFILAGTPSGSAMPDMGVQLKVYGVATLTCP